MRPSKDYAWASIMDHMSAEQATGIWSGHYRDVTYDRPRFMFANFTLTDAAMETAVRALAAMIERFEPRLVGVEVRAAQSPDPLVLAWEVRGKSRSTTRAHRFLTELDTFGRARVR